MKVSHILPFGEIFYGKHKGAIGIFLENAANNNSEYTECCVEEPPKHWRLFASFPGVRRAIRWRYYASILENLNRYDCVVVHNDIELVLSIDRKGKGKKIIFHLHNEYDLSALKSATCLMGVIVCSPYLLGHAKSYDLGVSVCVVPNGASFDTKVQSRLNKRRYQLGFVGRLDNNKGFKTIAGYLKRSNADFVVVAAKTPLSLRNIPIIFYLIYIAITCAERCTVRYNKSHANVIKTMREVDVLLVPTQYQEAFGMVALEGIACGSCVISNSVGGLTDVDVMSGKFYVNGKLEERGLNSLLGDRKKQEYIKDQQRNSAMSYDWSNISQQYREVLASLCIL